MAYKVITITVPKDVAAIVEEASKKERRSFSAQVAVMIERATERINREGENQ
jgi:hypothetical protein